MSKISKLQLKKLVEECSTSTALQIIIDISADIDQEVHHSAILNLSRYNENKNNYINGIDKPEVRNTININTLALIEKLPEKEFENPLPTLVRNIVTRKSTERKNKKLKLYLILTSILLIGGLIWLVLPKDPLRISGEWNYIVTPDYNGGKLLGRLSPDEPFKPIFDNICGDVEIKSIEFGTTNYTMTGKRTSMNYEKTKNALSEPIDLKFTELSHEKNGNSKHFFFRFEAYSDDKNKGFVTIDHFEGGQLPKMSGKIHYLYSDNQWKEVDIKFEKSNNK